MLTVTPIGIVRNEVKRPVLKGWATVVSDLILDERYAEGRMGSKIIRTRWFYF